MNFEEKVKRFAALLETQTFERMKRDGWTLDPYVVKVHRGRRWTRVDIGPECNMSGKYMIDQDGTIYGVKGYGVPHKGHRYGTLDEVTDWYWGEYTGFKPRIVNGQPFHA